MLLDSHSIRKIAVRITFIVPFLMYGSAHVLVAQGAQDYIVKFREGTNATARATVVRNAGAAAGFTFHRVNAAVVRVPNARALAALQNDLSVLAVIPNRPVFAYQVIDNGKDDNAKGKPGGGGGSAVQVIPAGVARVGVPTGTSNGNGVGVAVLDTGVDLAHADL